MREKAEEEEKALSRALERVDTAIEVVVEDMKKKAAEASRVERLFNNKRL